MRYQLSFNDNVFTINNKIAKKAGKLIQRKDKPQRSKNLNEMFFNKDNIILYQMNYIPTTLFIIAEFFIKSVRYLLS